MFLKRTNYTVLKISVVYNKDGYYIINDRNKQWFQRHAKNSVGRKGIKSHRMKKTLRYEWSIFCFVR